MLLCFYSDLYSYPIAIQPTKVQDLVLNLLLVAFQSCLIGAAVNNYDVLILLRLQRTSEMSMNQN